jgi:glycosyltransferase involved in cell wall biosynthesis
VPEVPFVVQESWPLNPEVLAAVQQQVAATGNVELRRAAPPGPWLYGDARVLLVPYRVDNRPRVVLEAQANGIPVVAADSPALSETVGAGGVLLPLDDEDAWAGTLRRLWGDDDYYRRLCAAATEHSRRPDVDPEAVGDAFVAVLSGVVS